MRSKTASFSCRDRHSRTDRARLGRRNPVTNQKRIVKCEAFYRGPPALALWPVAVKGETRGIVQFRRSRPISGNPGRKSCPTAKCNGLHPRPAAKPTRIATDEGSARVACAQGQIEQLQAPQFEMEYHAISLLLGEPEWNAAAAMLRAISAFT